ncbi:MarR family winged helix-turn-helix transcriptional regulator [Streptomyces sp. NPDC059651]|uniref:MarR family winged helix-turn-helix transcriptional regulator n=1 Tax=unclassified Streptomyces TaxID=2593676 RepID=UPI0036B7913E
MSAPGDEVPDAHSLLNAFAEVVGPLLDRTAEIFAGHQVPFSQANLLVQMNEMGGPRRMAVLAQAHGVAPRTVTSLVDGLEKRGLAARTPDPADRRVILVSLTEKGEALMQQIDETSAQLADETFAQLPAEDRVALAKLLGKIRTQNTEGKPES